MANATDRRELFDWLDSTIDGLPTKGQIILNFDGNIVEWETKVANDITDARGHRERTEVRKSGRLRIKGRDPLATLAPLRARA